MPLDKKAASKLVALRHPEWEERQRHWRWLADSLEGGRRYSHADYTLDPTADATAPGGWFAAGTGRIDAMTSERGAISYGQFTDRNLIPHLSESGPDGQDVYILRLSRTPVPALVERTVESHVSRIYAKEITRTGPAPLEAWWADADGRGTPIDRFMVETVAPLLCVLGQLDVCADHPPAPDGADVVSKADQHALGLDACVMSVVLPENLVWWRLDARKAAYAECLVYERCDGSSHFRHWTATESNAYDRHGELIPALSRKHPFGRVPLARVFDRRLVRCSHVGRSRYESIAYIQKAVYNARSELILSDVLASHPRLMMPEDSLQQDASIPAGPDNVIPMKRTAGSGGAVTYTPAAYLDPPKGAQQEVRTHVLDWLDEADRDGGIAKPAGMVAGTTVAQSGISKIADQTDGNAMLARVAEVLASAEVVMAGLALAVLTDGREAAKPGEITAVYPTQFDLATQGDLSQAADDVARHASQAGALPETQGELLKRMISVSLPGLDPERLAELHAEADAHMAKARAAYEAGPDDDDESTDSPPGFPGVGLTTST